MLNLDKKTVTRSKLRHTIPTTINEYHDQDPINNMATSVKGLANSAEIRSLPSVLDKVDVLYNQHKLELSAVCEYFGVNRRLYYRWLKRGKKDGKRGRKRALTPDEEAKLLDKIVNESKNQNSLTTVEIAKEVTQQYTRDGDCF